MRTILSILFAFACAATAQLVSYCSGTGQREFSPWYLTGNCQASVLYPQGTVGIDTNGNYWLHPSTFKTAAAWTIGIVDTGICTNQFPHVSFRGLNVNTGLEDPASIVPNPRGDTTHGTRVCSVLVGQHGFIETTGILSTASGVDDAHHAQAIHYLVTNGAKVVLYPYGFSSPQLLVSNEIAQASNVVFVCSAPEGSPAYMAEDYPSAHGFGNAVIALSVNRAGDLYGCKYSGRGVAAPGRIIFLEGCYDTGTSFAAAFVAGALAVTMERYQCSALKALEWMINNLEQDQDTIGRCNGRLRLDWLLDPVVIVDIREKKPPGVRVEAWTGNVWTNIGPPPIPFKANEKFGAFRAVAP